MTTLKGKITNIYKEHNGLTIEESLISSGIKMEYIEIPEQYVFANETDFIVFDNQGDLIESTIEVPKHILSEMSCRAKKTLTMVNSIWQEE